MAELGEQVAQAIVAHERAIENRNLADDKVTKYMAEIERIRKEEASKSEKMKNENESRRKKMEKEIASLKEKLKKDASLKKQKLKKAIEEKDGEIVKAKSEANHYHKKALGLEGDYASLD